MKEQKLIKTQPRLRIKARVQPPDMNTLVRITVALRTFFHLGDMAQEKETKGVGLQWKAGGEKDTLK